MQRHPRPSYRAGGKKLPADAPELELIQMCPDCLTGLLGPCFSLHCAELSLVRLKEIPYLFKKSHENAWREVQAIGKEINA